MMLRTADDLLDTWFSLVPDIYVSKCFLGENK